MIDISKRDKTTLLLFVYLIFFTLAFPSGIFTAAWVYMQATYGVSLDALGMLSISGLFGSLLGTVASGRLIGRFGTGRYLVAGAGVLALAMAIYALAPTWITLLAAMFMQMFGFNIINTGLNTFVSAHYSTGQLNWMHAAYPLGGTLGSLLVTLIVEDGGGSWHLAYAIVFVIMLSMGAALLITRDRWKAQDEAEARSINPDGAKRVVSLRQSFLLPAVMIGMALFFLTTGAGGTTINLSKSLLTARAIAGAGYWISFYWGFSFIGRVIVGFVAYRLNNVTLLRVCMIGMALGAALLWQPASAALNFVGLMLFGLASAPVYPTLIAESRRRVDPPHRANAIGFQIAASALGMALVPAGVAWLADHTSVNAIGAIPFVLMVVAVALYEFSLRRGESIVTLTKTPVSTR